MMQQSHQTSPLGDALETDSLVQLRREIETVQTNLRALHSAWPSADDLLASLQHDLRTPVGNILACVQLLQMEEPLSPGQAELVGIIEDSARRLVAMLDEARGVNASSSLLDRERDEPATG